MQIKSNPYALQLIQKGYSPAEIMRSAPAPKHSYPRVVGSRVFNTEQEYNDALADFLNSN